MIIKFNWIIVIVNINKIIIGGYSYLHKYWYIEREIDFASLFIIMCSCSSY
jgi:hypothetical protein